MLTIRVTGICCHVDPRGPQDKFGKRVIIARNGHSHHGGHEMTPHVPYLEVETADIASAPPSDPNDVYTRGPVTEYRKFVLDGEEIIIDPIEESQPFQVLDSFNELIPSMRKIAPSVPANPRGECFVPNTSFVAGYFDMTAGVLIAGEREQLPTKFRPRPPVEWPDQRNAVSSHLLLRLKQNSPTVITLRSIASGATRKITLKVDTREITIGNQPLEDIEGRPRRSADQPGAHFRMFYDLGPIDGTIQPGPEEVSTAINGCMPTNWP